MTEHGVCHPTPWIRMCTCMPDRQVELVSSIITLFMRTSPVPKRWCGSVDVLGFVVDVSIRSQSSQRRADDAWRAAFLRTYFALGCYSQDRELHQGLPCNLCSLERPTSSDCLPCHWPATLTSTIMAFKPYVTIIAILSLTFKSLTHLGLG